MKQMNGQLKLINIYTKAKDLYIIKVQKDYKILGNKII